MKHIILFYEWRFFVEVVFISHTLFRFVTAESRETVTLLEPFQLVTRAFIIKTSK